MPPKKRRTKRSSATSSTKKDKSVTRSPSRHSKRTVAQKKRTYVEIESHDDDDDFEHSSDDGEVKVVTRKSRKKLSGNRTMAEIEEILANADDIMDKVVEEKQRLYKKRKNIAPTLEDLQLDNVNKEVLNMDALEVARAVEQMFLDTFQSIMEGKGFSFNVPIRSSTNQLYVEVLDRIVLKDRVSQRDFGTLKNNRKAVVTLRIMELIHELCLKQIHTTKRDLYYNDVKLFQKQKVSDDVIDDVACMVGCTRTSLNVVASEKGVVVGRLTFVEDGDAIDCSRMGSGGKAIPPYVDRITDIESDAQFILLVEKDAAFMRLAEDRFYNSFPCIIITAKGQPDVATRLFLKRLKTALNIPVLGLVDSDPYGLKILSVYMSGSKNMSYDSASLTTPDIKWLGVRPSDLDAYNIPKQCRLDMTESDIKTGKEMLNEEFIRKNPQWHAELSLMVKSKEKAEIQALSTFGFQYLTRVYLPKKLQQGDWI